MRRSDATADSSLRPATAGLRRGQRQQEDRANRREYECHRPRALTTSRACVSEPTETVQGNQSHDLDPSDVAPTCCPQHSSPACARWQLGHVVP